MKTPAIGALLPSPAARTAALSARPRRRRTRRGCPRGCAPPEAPAEDPRHQRRGRGGTEPAPKRAPADASDAPPASVVDAALAAFGGNFAVIHAVPVTGVKHCTHVEGAHQMRWLPQGPRAADRRAPPCSSTRSRAARRWPRARSCKRSPWSPRSCACRAGAELRQLAPLYALTEAAEFDDAPHPLGTGKELLVTRPCAIARGVLSFPTGRRRRRARGRTEGAWDNATLELQDAMKKTEQHPSARNALRREGLLPNVYRGCRPPPRWPSARHPLATAATPDGGGGAARP